MIIDTSAKAESLKYVFETPSREPVVETPPKVPVSDLDFEVREVRLEPVPFDVSEDARLRRWAIERGYNPDNRYMAVYRNRVRNTAACVAFRAEGRVGE